MAAKLIRSKDPADTEERANVSEADARPPQAIQSQQCPSSSRNIVQLTDENQVLRQSKWSPSIINRAQYKENSSKYATRI